MGNYNPHSPYILGQEWVPIQDLDLVYSPSVNSIELGTTYVQQTAQRLRTARFYVNQMQATNQSNQTGLVNIYPIGTEDQTGPIRQVLIPCSAVQVTGAGVSFSFSSSGPEAVYQPGDFKYIEVDYNASSRDIAFWFSVNQYPELANKRILNVSVMYVGNVQDRNPADGNSTEFINPTPATSLTVVRQRNDTGTSVTFSPPTFITNTGVLTLATSIANANDNAFLSESIEALDIGDINNYWDSTINPLGTNDRMPWRYADLQRFDPSYGAGRQHIFVRFQTPITPYQTANPASIFPFVAIEYMALRVIYCEEKRVAYGAKNFFYDFGMNAITMRDLSFNTDPVLPAGSYLPTLSWVSSGQIDYGQNSSGNFPKLNQLRELYAIPSHTGVQVNVPFPLADRIGDVFTSEVTHKLPQLTLHASGGPLTDPHVYGRQAIPRIYGSNTATQLIYDDISGVAASYPQVRFYARRFGNTTIPLTLTGVGSLSGSTASISVTDFDALAAITSAGWKEVTLRFGTPPSMGAVAGYPAWTWSAAGETAGNHWEILAASAPAISGTPGNNFNLVPSPNQLGTATYQPPTGVGVYLNWFPQGVGSPWVTGASNDTTTDAVLIFSQDPPTVTGFALTAATQTVTGLGFNCGTLPCCIPSGISYQRLAWTATTLPTTGFGAYELQRWDNLVSDFQTIMLGTDPTIVAFNDFEARVGVTSVYRVRSINALNFAGQWSSYVSGAPPAPGVTSGTCGDGTGALIFTSNADQSGAHNAAYVMQWEGTPNEDFTLPEADMVAFQPMYGRDGSIAFHGTERGLEVFNRVVLLHAAAIDPVRLADAKTIRDLAWQDLPYVCVRDDIGDRWLANVRVPTIAVRNNRQAYLGSLEITELTQTPYAVDP